MAGYEYTINEAKKEIKNSISVYMMKDEGGSYIIPENKKNPFYVIGAPGIGKTEMASQIAAELGIGFMATSLSHHTRNSVLGLPFITDFNGNKSTEYTISDILLQVMKKCKDGQTEGILLIDEFASMSEALVAPMLAFLQNKCIGNHYLPEGWVIILCSNPPEYNETARVFGPAVIDRVRIMNVKYSREDFLIYAKESGMHPIVVDYVKNNDKNVYVCNSSDDESEIVTTRGWENLSQCLYGYERLEMDISDNLIYQFIKSESIARDFYNYYMLCTSAIKAGDVRNIIQGMDIEKNVSKMKKIEFNKKMQTADVIVNQLASEVKPAVEVSKLTDYLKEWIDTWKSELTKDNVCMDMLINGGNYMENVIKSRLGMTTLGFGIQNYPEVLRKREYDYHEEQMLKKILQMLNDKKKEKGVMNADNIMVVDIMQQYYDLIVNKTENELEKQNKKISNVFNYLNKVNDVHMKEYFVKKLNLNDELLYILSKVYNKEYTEELSSIYGNLIKVS